MNLFCLLAVLIVCVCAHEVKERISCQKCREYGQNVQSPCVYGDESTSELAVAKEFPHMALIGHGTSEDDIEWICSGSLISDQYVLSAAHCAASVPIKGRPKWIRLGELDLTSTDDSQTRDFNISETIIRPDYIRPSVYNDIVLFKLEHPVEITNYIRPACLASEQHEVDAVDRFIVSGWGEERGEAHRHMKQDKNIRKVGYEECNKAYENSVGSRRFEKGVSNHTQLCATPSQTQACHIKSGAPLQYLNKKVECMYNIAGILSTGLGFCGTTPEIYTNVAAYVEWIESVVWGIFPETL